MPVLSVIVPTRENEDAWRTLLGDFKTLPRSAEVIIVGPQFGCGNDPSLPTEPNYSLRFCGSEQGRARQLNAGAAVARGPFLWFVHSDSHLPEGSIAELLLELQQTTQRELRYFKLAFQSDGPPLMRLNAVGANLRARLFGIPFGDQGFLLRRDLFHELGMFDEQCAFGEDHLFIWSCRARGVKLRAFRGKILTSARKYREQGWMRTTATHLLLTLKQALPELWRHRQIVAERTDV